MKREGFTLVELLAVIAILALLIIIAVPNVTKIFNDAKKDTFISETKIIYKEALREYVKRSRTQKVTHISSEDSTKLNLDGMDYKYYFVFNDEGELVGSKVSDDTYVITIAEGTDINDIKTSDLAVGKIENFDYTEILATPVSFAKDSWKTIKKEAQECVKSETYDCKYKVGDTKDIALKLDGVNDTIKTIRISNISTPSACSNEGFSQTACGFVIEFVENIQPQHPMNAEITNKGGWEKTEMRDYLTNTFINTFPDDLKNIIIDTKVVSSLGKSEGCSSSGGGGRGGKGSSSSCTNVNTTNDKLYMLALIEILNSSNSNDSAKDKTRQLDYYSAQGTSSSNVSAALKNCNVTHDVTDSGVVIKKNETRSWYYFLRSAYAGDDKSFFFLAGDTGNISYAEANRYDLCVPIAFRIAAKG